MILLYVLITFCALPIPQRLTKPGIVVLGSRKCNYTQKIIDRLTAQGKPFTIEYIDNDKELNNYIVDEHRGGIPIVFENGVYQGTGKEYVNKQYGGVSQPVPQPFEPVKPQPVPQPIQSKPTAPQPVEPVKPQPVPQPIEPVTIQPAAPQPIAPQPITSQTSTPNPIAPPPSPQQPVAPKTTLPCVINSVTNPVICKN